MSIWKGLAQGFTDVAELPNACRHVEQRVQEDKYEQLQPIGDALRWPSKKLNATPVLNPVSSPVRHDTGLWLAEMDSKSAAKSCSTAAPNHSWRARDCRLVPTLGSSLMDWCSEIATRERIATEYCPQSL